MPSSGQLATPNESVSRQPSRSMPARLRCSRRQTVRALAFVVSGRSRANSSPPMRKTLSAGRMPRRSSVADLAQRVVSRHVPARVVDLLEVVDVGEHEREARRARRHQPAHRLVEAAVVREAGERVRRRLGLLALERAQALECHRRVRDEQGGVVDDVGRQRRPARRSRPGSRACPSTCAAASRAGSPRDRRAARTRPAVARAASPGPSSACSRERSSRSQVCARASSPSTISPTCTQARPSALPSARATTLSTAPCSRASASRAKACQSQRPPVGCPVSGGSPPSASPSIAAARCSETACSSAPGPATSSAAAPASPSGSTSAEGSRRARRSTISRMAALRAERESAVALHPHRDGHRQPPVQERARDVAQLRRRQVTRERCGERIIKALGRRAGRLHGPSLVITPRILLRPCE